MAMISFERAWREFATRSEVAVFKATHRISPDAVDAVVERARRAGYLVSSKAESRRDR